MSLKKKWLSGGQELRIPHFKEAALFVQVDGGGEPSGKPMRGIATVIGPASTAPGEMLAALLDILAARRIATKGLEFKYVCPQSFEKDLGAAFRGAQLSHRGKTFAASETLEVWLRSEDLAIKIRVEDAAKPAASVGPAGPVVRPADLKKLKVMVVDDSATIRKIMRKILSENPGVAEIEDIGDPEKVAERLKVFKPDLMTLDINMPGMNGDVLLKKLGGSSFTVPTLILTSLNINESRSVMDCLEMGAFDYLHKPESGQMDDFKGELGLRIDLIRNRISAPTPVRARPASRAAGSPLTGAYDPNRLFVLGASTGGTEAIKNVLIHMPAGISPTLIVQHIPPYFSKAFADRLNDLCNFEVKEAEDGDELRMNRVLVAPGNFHVRVSKQGGKWIVNLNQDPLMSGHRPSVDYMYKSVAEAKHPDVVAVLLTGMGKDGAEGMKILRDMGFPTVAQDEATSVVYGMPKAAALNGGAAQILGLDVIPEELMQLLAPGKRKKSA